MERKLTCIICPKGCEITLKTEGDKIVALEGNTCVRGEKYAENEFKNPVRSVTSTVRCNNGDVISVKTSKAIPKDKIFECMKKINSAKTDLPVSVGDVIIKDVFAADIIATQNKR